MHSLGAGADGGRVCRSVCLLYSTLHSQTGEPFSIEFHINNQFSRQIYCRCENLPRDKGTLVADSFHPPTSFSPYLGGKSRCGKTHFAGILRLKGRLVTAECLPLTGK